MESIVFVLTLAASLAVLVGWIWIVVKAFSDGEVLWGIGCLIISPLALVYGFLNLDELKVPLLAIAGGFLAQVLLVLVASQIA